MKIIRSPLVSGFTKVPNIALRDERLSYKARGIHARLLSHLDDGWTETADTLAEKSPDGRHAVRTGLQELVLYGYVAYSKSQNKAGHWVTEMVVYDVPISPESDNPTPVAEDAEPQVGPESGFPTSDDRTSVNPTSENLTLKEKTTEKTIKKIKEENTKVSQSAQELDAARLLHARYRLTDHESAQVIAEARRRAANPIRNLVPYLTGEMTTNGSLAVIVEAVQKQRTPEPEPPAPERTPQPLTRHIEPKVTTRPPRVSDDAPQPPVDLNALRASLAQAQSNTRKVRT